MASVVSSFWCGEMILQGGSLAMPLVFTLAYTLVSTAPAFGQNAIVPDTTLGAEGSQVTPINATTDQIDGGALRGANLFHSFQEFNVSEGLQVYFGNPAGVENIFSRVTGSNPSNVLGRLGIEGEANLFLINPNGIVFGSEASLDVEGSFLAMTGSAIAFQDGSEFGTHNSQSTSPLTVSVPLGLQQRPETIGGAIDNEAALSAGGNLTLIADAINSQRSLQAGGDIRIAGNNLTLAEGGRLDTATLGNGDIGSVIVDVTDTARFDGVDPITGLAGGAFSGIRLGTAGIGGDIRITANNLTVAGGAQLSSENFGSGEAGDIVVDVTGRASFDGFDQQAGLLTSGAFSNLESGGTGTSGEIRISANTLDVLNGAQLNTSTVGLGDAGNVTIDTQETVRLDGINPNTGFSSGVASTIAVGATGNGGDVRISANNLELSNGAQIGTTVFGAGDAGNIILEIVDTVTVDGFEERIASDGSEKLIASTIASSIASGGEGTAGDIRIILNTLNVLNGGRLTSATSGIGDAGNLIVEAAGTVQLGGENGPGDFSTAISSSILFGGQGIGGDIQINARNLEITDTARIDTGISDVGTAGNLIIDLTEQITLDNGFIFSFSSAGEGVEGDGGDINITADRLVALNGARLDATTITDGNGGNINVNVAQTVRFTGRSAADGRPTTVSSNIRTGGAGRGGDIQIAANRLEIADGAQISASNQGIGDAGDISLRTRDQLIVDNGSIQTSSTAASGGNVTINSRAVRLYGDGDIETSVSQDDGRGGDITITADSVVAFGDSDILADSRNGQGGNITLATPAFFGENYQLSPATTNSEELNGNGRVDVNADGVVSGIVTVPDVSFVQNDLVELPEKIVPTQQLIANSCIARSEVSGSFVVSSGGAFAERPNDSAISLYPTGNVRALSESTRTASTETTNDDWQPGDPIVESQGVFQLSDGRLVMSRGCRAST